MHRASSTELDMPQRSERQSAIPYVKRIRYHRKHRKAYTVSSYIVDREVDRGGAVPRATCRPADHKGDKFPRASL